MTGMLMNQGKSFNAIMLISTGILLIVGAAIFFIWDNPPTVSEEIPQIPTPENTPTEIKRVSVRDAKAAHDLGTAVFVDVRASQFYQESHIPGSLSIPLSEITERLNELDPQAWIITYCT